MHCRAGFAPGFSHDKVFSCPNHAAPVAEGAREDDGTPGVTLAPDSGTIRPGFIGGVQEIRRSVFDVSYSSGTGDTDQCILQAIKNTLVSPGQQLVHCA